MTNIGTHHLRNRKIPRSAPVNNMGKHHLRDKKIPRTPMTPPLPSRTPETPSAPSLRSHLVKASENPDAHTINTSMRPGVMDVEGEDPRPEGDRNVGVRRTGGEEYWGEVVWCVIEISGSRLRRFWA